MIPDNESNTNSPDKDVVCLIPLEDLAWVYNQKQSVIKLLIECWLCDQSGNTWTLFTTKLKNSTFLSTRKIIQKADLFLFKKTIGYDSKTRKHYGEWEILNLHGSIILGGKRNVANNYYKFLKTDYWYYVRDLVLRRDNWCCQKCNHQDKYGHGLQVHHRTYDHHGNEHNHLDDLTTLCVCCHHKLHGK